MQTLEKWEAMHLYQLNPTSKRPTVRWMTFNKSKFSTVQNCFWSLNSSRATMEKKGYTHPNKVNLYSLNIKEWFWRKRTIKPGDIIFQFQWKTNNFWGLAFKPAICSQSLGISKKGHIYIYTYLSLTSEHLLRLQLAWRGSLIKAVSEHTNSAGIAKAPNTGT